MAQQAAQPASARVWAGGPACLGPSTPGRWIRSDDHLYVSREQKPPPAAALTLAFILPRPFSLHLKRRPPVAPGGSDRTAVSPLRQRARPATNEPPQSAAFGPPPRLVRRPRGFLSRNAAWRRALERRPQWWTAPPWGLSPARAFARERARRRRAALRWCSSPSPRADGAGSLGCPARTATVERRRAGVLALSRAATASGGSGGVTQVNPAAPLSFPRVGFDFTLSIRGQFAFLFHCFFRFVVETFPNLIYTLDRLLIPLLEIKSDH